MKPSISVSDADKNKDIRTVFLAFYELDQITGPHIETSIISFQEQLRIDNNECRRQCYHDLTNIHSGKSGTASNIL